MSEQENTTTVSDNKTTDNPKDKTNGLANGGMSNLNMIKSGGRFLTTSCLLYTSDAADE